MLFLILRQNLQRFAIFVQSLIDCLLTPKPEGQELEGFDVETFPLLVILSLESRIGLIQVAVTPLRSKDVEIKAGQLELFCTEVDGCLVRIGRIRTVGVNA